MMIFMYDDVAVSCTMGRNVLRLAIADPAQAEVYFFEIEKVWKILEMELPSGDLKYAISLVSTYVAGLISQTLFPRK